MISLDPANKLAADHTQVLDALPNQWVPRVYGEVFPLESCVAHGERARRLFPSVYSLQFLPTYLGWQHLLITEKEAP